METILSLLNNLQTKGSFATRLAVPTDNLQLTVADLGPLKFPLTQRRAKALIKVARPAKFGWREQTLLDKKVRDVWEIPKSKVKIDRRTWNKTLQPLLEQIQTELGMPEAGKLKAHLHNLLVYEPGQFFQPHQDSEKLDGMVATLVVVLPCEHNGGDLIVDHRGKKKRIKSSRTSLEHLTCIGFYADCHHEVKPVKTGYRVALTYNLVLEGVEGGADAIVTNTDTATALAQALRDYFDRAADNDETSNRLPSPPLWLYLLDHEYTPKGLSWKQLKNSDQTRARLLQTAAGEAGLTIHLALAEIHETWDCYETGYDSYDYYRSRHRSYWEEDEDEEEEDYIAESDGDNYELNEMIEYYTTLSHWRDAKDKKVGFSNIHFSHDELCCTKPNESFTPFASEYEGFMGNYGNTLDRWYHRAVIVVWRREDDYAMQCEADRSAVIKQLRELAARQATRAEARRIVESILPYWQRYCRPNAKPNPAAGIFGLARSLASPDLAEPLVAPLGLEALTPAAVPGFVKLAGSYGEKWCLDRLNAWSTPSNHYSHPKMLDKFPQLIDKLVPKPGGKSANAAPKTEAILQWLFDYQFNLFDAQNKRDAKEFGSRWSTVHTMAPERFATVINLLNACIAANFQKYHHRLLMKIMADKRLYPIVNLVELWETQQKRTGKIPGDWEYEKLHDYLHREISAELNLPRRDKDDWSIREKLSCTCADCKTLKKFLVAKTQKTKIWPLAGDRRQHIEGEINYMELPVSHTTETTGRPYKLVLNKTAQLFFREENRRKILEKVLQRLMV